MKDQADIAYSTGMATTTRPGPATFGGEMKVDVCVVGAGIAGLTTAYMLGLEGKSVVVMDDLPPDGGTEGAKLRLTQALDDHSAQFDFPKGFHYGPAPADFKFHLPVRGRQLHGCWLELLHGEKGSRLAAQSHTSAIDWIDAIVTNEKIDCDFERVDGYLFVPPGGSLEILERELAAAHRAGLTEVQRLARAPVDTFDTGPCLRFPRQAQFHPLKYLNGLVHVVQRNGGRLFSRTQAAKIEGGRQAWVETKEGWVVLADAVVVATNRPVNDRAAIHTRLAPHRTYAIGAKVPPGSALRALYWDTADPCHCVRVHHIPVGRWVEAAYDLIIVGGEDHLAEQAVDGETRWARLEEWARKRFPMISAVEYRWSGQVREPFDGLAFIGPNPLDKPNVYIAAGNPVSGMIHGPIAGRLLTDLICGRENEWADLYDPRRISWSAPPSIPPAHPQHRRVTRRFDQKRRERLLG